MHRRPRQNDFQTTLKTIALAGLCLGLLLATVPGPARALPGPPPSKADGKALSQFIHNSWSSKDGLPQELVSGIAQTPDGYLWIGTQEGLVRFDGLKFHLYNHSSDPVLSKQMINVMVNGHNGDLWLGTWSGLVRVRDGRFDTFGAESSVPESRVLDLAITRDGDVWLNSGNRLLRTRDGRCIATGFDFPAQCLVVGLESDSAGNLWVATTNAVMRINGSIIERFALPPELTASPLTTINAGPNGEIWVATANAIGHLAGGRFVAVAGHKEGLPEGITTLATGGDNSLWVGTDGNGLGRWQDGHFSLMREGTRIDDSTIMCLNVDRDGTLWVGSFAFGLHSLRTGSIVTYSTAEGLSHPNARAVCGTPDGSIWVGTNADGLNRIQDGRITTLTTADGLAGNVIGALHPTADGNLLVGTEMGICRVDLQSPTPESSVIIDLPMESRAIHEDRTGAIWIGTVNTGLLHFQDNVLTAYSTQDGLPTNTFKGGFVENSDGTMWVGSSAGPLLIDIRTKALLPLPEGAPKSTTLALFRDSTGAIWFGTTGDGLVRFQDRTFTSFSVEDGLYDRLAFHILEGKDGRLWISCNRGVYSVARADFDAYTTGHLRKIPHEAFGRSDGMKSQECNGGWSPAGFETKDGRLWFSTIDGVASIDPTMAASDQTVPQVNLESALIKNVQALHVDQYEAPAGGGDLEFQYSAPNFLAPQKIRFRYRLVGYDRQWVDAGARDNAYYTNIPSGDYSFEVQASSPRGAFGGEPTRIAFKLPPRFYQTMWFQLIGILAVFALGTGIYRWRVSWLETQARDLEKVVAERTTELVQAKEEAIVANRTRGEFLANMSHEIRTPMNGFIGMMHLIKDTELNEDQNLYVTTATTAAESLLDLINDILDFSKIDAGRLEFENIAVEVRPLIAEIIRILAFQAEKKSLPLLSEIANDVPQRILIDPLRLRQVLTNLIGNAVKFTAAGSVTLQITTAGKTAKGTALRFGVIDTGTGVSPEQQKVIFDAFSQADNTTTRKFGGTGLGLSISSQLVRMMGGQLSVTSELGNGSEFHFTAPFEVAEPLVVEETAQKPRPDTSEVAQKTLQVLVAEDNRVNQIVVQRFVKKAGHEALIVENGQEAVDAYRDGTFDVLLLDLQMPVMGGLEASQIIRELEQQESRPRVPIVALTADVCDGVQQRCQEAGMDRYVSKPINPAKLNELLSEVAETQSLSPDLLQLC
ncbi:MAG: two-component regulator propeller domain-containing protein [Candidatus Krumholzibacteria bacterium]|nr:two-component regulator propeller domain-containing protein [Candidatus Krumholzibacteria bacterium]